MSFFHELRKKIERNPSAEFDQKMRRSLDLEMGLSLKNPAKILLPSFRILIPSAGLAAALLIYFSIHSPSSENISIAENLEFLQSLETLTSIEEEELISASDEEWAEALDGVDS